MSFFVAILILSGMIFCVGLTLPQNASATNDMAAEVVELINEIRAENGLSELTVYVELQQVADLRASEIMEVFSHNRPDGTTCDTAYTLFGISTSACAENIAAGYSTAQSVVEGWMSSENHRANILNAKYTHIAVGLVYDASSEYKYYWVQEFSADYTVTATTTAATTTVAPTTTAVTTTAAPTTVAAPTTTATPTTTAETTTVAPITTVALTTTVAETTAAPTTTVAETTTAAPTTTAPTTMAPETTTVAETTTVVSTTTLEEITTETVEASEIAETEETAEETEASVDEDTSSTNGKTGVVTGIKAKIIGDGYVLEFSLPVPSEDEKQSDSSYDAESAESIREDESGTEDGQIDSEGDSDEAHAQANGNNEFAESELDAQGGSDSETESKEESGVSFFDILPWCIIALLVVVIGILVIYIILMKRKKDEEDDDKKGENDNI